ncbi:MAG: O-antigen ligase family protein [Bacteroidales bacterium]|nr:O-antigen ligase family protein [Bacteroidales bacterium]
MSWFRKNASLITAMIVTAAFLVANFILLAKDFYWLFLLPLAGLVLLLFILRFETGLLVTALLTPFAVDFALIPGMELSMPVEPMMILFTVMFIFRVLAVRWYSRDVGYDIRLLRHPVSIAVLAMLVWMVVSAATSLIPAVSFKYFAARLWFVVPFFFAAAQIFRNRDRMRQFVWCYAFSLVVVILITTAKTFGSFHDLQTLHRVMRPFYNDHTAYGCVIALFVPVSLHFIVSEQGRTWLKPLMLCCFAAMMAGLFLSYSRAAWISVMGAAAVYLAIRIGMKVKWMLLVFALGVTLFFTYQSDVLYKLSKNKQDSSYDLSGQVKSISNISTDASNLERLNRWASAIRMFKERPLLGCGPGTYQFLYARYQRSYQLSEISTNAGNLGNAHSEYIGPLTEQGVPGAVCILAIFLTTFATGVRVYRTAADPAVARLALAFTLSLLTYYIHGVFNNFLDTDKLSVPFWAFTAAVVALDVYSKKESESVETDVDDCAESLKKD